MPGEKHRARVQLRAERSRKNHKGGGRLDRGETWLLRRAGTLPAQTRRSRHPQPLCPAPASPLPGAGRSGLLTLCSELDSGFLS